jgi:hypothetical protein
VTKHLSRDSGVPLSDKDALVYRSTMGALQYLTLTRQICPLLLTKYVSFSLGPLLSIGKLSSAFSSLLKRLLPWDSF